mmetsp:Transcript_30070/g.82578  ORF Transcript_30070/g.82578 Transcript_30070/m.82578 type:complete len:510 (+) Transcript_30070:87-1616(+)
MLRLTLSAGRAAARKTPMAATTASGTTTRTFADMMDKQIPEPRSQELIDKLPDIPFTTAFGGEEYEYKTPVTSAHMIEGEKVSTKDSVAISPEGSVVHGRYGALPEPAASSVPLEFLALLRPAAQGAAAMRILNEKAGGKKGTVLVYGCSLPAGTAAGQLASTSGNAVVGVVTSHHSGNDDLSLSMKETFPEPGLAVPEEFALCKGAFRDVVQGIVTGDEGLPESDPDAMLQEFKKNFVDYCEAYPDSRPAAVDEEVIEWKEGVYMPKDQEFFDINMEAYLSQFPPGAPPVDQAKLDAVFTPQQYQVFRDKFWAQTTALLTETAKDFSPPHEVQNQIREPEDPAKAMAFASGFPFSFSIFNKKFPEEMDMKAGGAPIGAVIVATPELMVAVNAVAAAGKTVREMMEALAFVTKEQKDAFLTVRSVIQNVGNAPVVVIGAKIAGFESVMEPEDKDISEALSAMDIDEAGNTRVNFFVQSYRASDFPFYGDYAIHRANEVCSGPRNIIVLK